MKDLESSLRTALGRVEAPEGFAERVLARARRPRPWAAFPRAWLATAAALALVLGGAGALHLQHRRAEEARAQAQLMLALGIASHQLNTAFEKLSTDKENP